MTIPGSTCPRVTEWMVGNIPDVVAPLAVEFISGGRSNLTYRIVDGAGRQLVLRRPPLGNVLQSAHDMGREHRIIAALAPTDVPVAEALGYCDDVTVNGAPFYVMGFVGGAVLATITDAEAYPEASRRPASDDLIDVLCRLHAVDPDEVGLETLARKEGYIERQLKRWHRQFEQSKTRELPVLDEVHRRLAEHIPPQRWTGIVHGDYRLGNMILGPDGELRAVLDWELATLGDTLADVGWLLSSWLEAGEVDEQPVPGADHGGRVPDAGRAGRPLRPHVGSRPVRPAVLPGVQSLALGVHRRRCAGPLQVGRDGRGRLRHRPASGLGRGVRARRARCPRRDDLTARDTGATP